MSETNGTRVALVQVASPVGEDVTTRIERVLGACRATAGADLVLLPELWATGYFAFDRYEAEASGLDGPLVAAMRQTARDAGCFLFGGSVLERSAEGIHNTAVLIDRTGEIVLTYRKCHLFGLGTSREASLLVPGDDAPVVETELGPIGAMTCYDLRFPELARSLLDRGAQLVLVAAAWPDARVEHWRVLLRARALENQLYVIGCNAAGDAGGVPAAGHSAVVDPWGELVVELGREPETRALHIELGAVAAARGAFPVLADRRGHTIGAGDA